MMETGKRSTITLMMEVGVMMDRTCGGRPDQIISWGGPLAAFRWDNADDVDIKDFSVREILPQSLIL